MTKRIYKYELAVVDRQFIRMTRHSDILSVQVQNGKICLWASVTLDEYHEDVAFFIVGTGHNTPEGEYLATVQIGELVWHVYKGFKLNELLK